MKKQQILITGASGTVGQEVLQLLAMQPQYQLVVLDRVTPTAKRFYQSWEKRISIIDGDITDADTIEKIPSSLDAVIHLAAIIPPAADAHPQRAWQVNVTGTQMLLAHLQRNSPHCFFLFSSSVSVYGDRLKNPDILVTDPVHASVGDAYAESKIAAEQLVQESTLHWSIFRLAAIMKNHKMSKLMFHMPLDTSMEICTPEDTARAFVKALSCREQLVHKIYNLGGGATCRISYREFLQRSFQQYGLGQLNFPKYAFAQHNFHCGNMADGDQLEALLHFRKDTLEDYFAAVAKRIHFSTRLMATLFRPIIKWGLLQLSEPYKAVRKQNKKQLQQFFPSGIFQSQHRNKSPFWSWLTTVLLLLITSSVQAQTILLKIANIRTKKGQVCVAFFENQKQFSSEKAVYTVRVPKDKIVNNSLSVSIPFKEGNYGLSVLDDTDNDGLMSYQLLSLPKEGFGFSNYYHKGLSKPSFNDFQFSIAKNETKEINVQLRYLP